MMKSLLSVLFLLVSVVAVQGGGEDAPPTLDCADGDSQCFKEYGQANAEYYSSKYGGGKSVEGDAPKLPDCGTNFTSPNYGDCWSTYGAETSEYWSNLFTADADSDAEA